jgi:hypothetical protein
MAPFYACKLLPGFSRGSRRITCDHLRGVVRP